jgi:hypothetical protein
VFYWEVQRVPFFDRRRVPWKLFDLQQNAVMGRRSGIKVLLATDGSEFSVAAIRSVAKRPWAKGSEFRVIAIPEPFMAVSPFPFELKEVEKLNGAALKRRPAVCHGGRADTCESKLTSWTRNATSNG